MGHLCIYIEASKQQQGKTDLKHFTLILNFSKNLLKVDQKLNWKMQPGQTHRRQVELQHFTDNL